MSIAKPFARFARAAAALTLLAGLLAACAAPAPSSEAAHEPAAAPVAASDAPRAAPAPIAASPSRPVEAPVAAAPRTRPAPPMSDPLPPQLERAPRSGGPVIVDRSCKTDADCTVKDVGNCCGHYPACVNKASPTDPQGVQAQCAKDGMASVCGFQEIRGCQCVQGQCQADAQGGGLIR